MSMKTKSPLSYYGSDAGVARDLGRLLDHCNHVTIPFVGGASILPHLKARAIVANDRHCDAINFYRVVSGVYGNSQRDILIERCQRTLSHPSELEMARLTLGDTYAPVVERAWAFWAECWIGRKGKGGTSSPSTMPSVRRKATGGTNASRIRAAADDLTKWSKHFERCEWESCCFRGLIPKVADDGKCGLYCDPPWVRSGNEYLHPFSTEDHCDLTGLLERFEHTTIVVRYGDDPLLRDLYQEPRWTWIEAESRTQANALRGEVWIVRNLTEQDQRPLNNTK